MSATETRVAGDPGTALLRGVDLAHDYGTGPVLRVPEIEIRAGEVLAVLGPNGAGKSTLMRVLAGLEPARHGTVYYRGRPVAPRSAEYRRRVVAVLQRPYLWRGTVADNVEFGLRVRGVSGERARQQAGAALDALGIARLLDAPVRTLSGGEAQRVALARALVLDAEVLFLDEPTADLDVSVRRQLVSDLERIVHRAAPAIVLITHDPGEAFALASRIAVMEGGRIVQSGRPEDIFEAPATEFVASFTGAEFLLRGRVEEVGEGTVGVRLDSGHRVLASGTADHGRSVRIAYRPEDVLLGPADSGATSARNRFPATVVRARPHGGLVRLRLEADGLQMIALVTRSSVDELGLKPGASVIAQLKASALHLFPA